MLHRFANMHHRRAAAFAASLTFLLLQRVAGQADAGIHGNATNEDYAGLDGAVLSALNLSIGDGGFQLNPLAANSQCSSRMRVPKTNVRAMH